MTQNKVILNEYVKLGSEYNSKERVRVVSNDPAKFRDVAITIEIYTGTDAMDNEQWRRADSSERTRILEHLGMLFVKQLQDQIFGVKNV